MTNLLTALRRRSICFNSLSSSFIFVRTAEVLLAMSLAGAVTAELLTMTSNVIKTMTVKFVF